ncbi:MAG: class I SAM-dependent methyltransferase, partial [Geminicoccales bacterium]
PEGRLAFVCWGPLEVNPWFSVPLAVGVARLGPPAPSPPRAPGPLAFSEPAYVREILETAGFEAVTIEPRTIHLIGGATTADEARLCRALGPLARLINEQAEAPPPAVLDEIVAEVAARLDGFVTEQGVRIPAAVFLVTARQQAQAGR